MNRIPTLTALALILCSGFAIAQNWQQGFDFRATAGYVNDPPTSTYVLATTAYPTTVNGVTFGWANTALVASRDRSTMVDPRLAGINYASNASPATFYVDLPSAGSYNLLLAMGDDGYTQCWTKCQIQFLDGNTLLGTVSGGQEGLGYFYDATGKNWSATAWPGSNVALPVTLSGTRLTVVVGSNLNTGDITPIAFLGIVQTSAVPNFTLTANPSSLSVQQGMQGTSTITTRISGGFDSAINLSASGLPSGTTVGFAPNPIAAPGAGSSTMTFTVGSNTPVGTYPITVTGNGGGIEQQTTVTLTVTAMVQPDFTIAAQPTSLLIGQGNQGTSTISTTVMGGFNSAISLSANGVPTGTTVSFAPNPIAAPGAGSSIMTVVVGANTVLGTYPITVMGTGGGTQHSVTVTLTVTTGSQPDFNFAVGPEALNVVQGSKAMAGVYTNLLRGFDNAISLSASGLPSGVTLTFNPNPIPAPGGGSSQVAITTANNTPLGTYAITIMGSGGGVQHSASLSLTVVSPIWQQGFDFRGTVGYVSDPPDASSVVPGDLYPTDGQLATYGWQTGPQVGGSDRSRSVDARLAGLNYVSNGSPASFYIDLPAPGTYSLSLAMGDEGYAQCFVQCQIQFKDADRVLATLTRGLVHAGYFYDSNGNQWSAATWPASNTPLQVTMTGTELNVVVGTINPTGDSTPIAYLGVQQVSTTPTFALDAPGTVTVGQGEYGTVNVSTLLVGGFNSSIALSASGAPQGTTISFNPNTIPAPGAGTSVMTIIVAGNTAQGTYPLLVTANGGGVVENWHLLLTVGPPTQPDFSLDVPAAVSSAPGSQTTAEVDTTITGSFNSVVTLSASGMPPGTSVSFNPNPIPAPGGGTSTVTVTVSSNTLLGSYALTVAADSNGIHHAAPMTLTVSASGKVNLPAGTGWLQLGPTTEFCSQSPGATYFNELVGAVDALDFLSLCQQGSMVGYSGGTADTNGDRFFLWTSGHNNYQGNEMYELDLQGSTPTVSRITEPAWTVDNTDVPPDCACRGTLNCGQGMWHDGANNPVPNPYSEAASGGPKFESIPAPDGSYSQPSCGYGNLFQPNARETYAGLTYNPSTQKMFSFGGVPAANPTSTGMFSNWSLDLVQKPPKWSRLKDSSYSWYTSAIYDYTAGHATSGYHLVFNQGQTLYVYNESTDQYTTLANALPYLGYNTNMELDPIHHVVVLENGDNFGGYHLRIVNLDSCNGTTCTFANLDQESSCSGALGYWAGIAWDSRRKAMTIFPSATNCSGGGCVAPFNKAYLLNPDANNPITITYKGQQYTIPPQKCFAVSYGSHEGVDYPPVSVGPGVYSRFKYFPHEDVYLFVQHPNNGVWILRLE
jgi:uncharacterized membrane protein